MMNNKNKRYKQTLNIMRKKIEHLEKLIEEMNESIKTQNITVVDKKGMLRIELLVHPTEDRTILALSDINGDARIGLIVLPNGIPALRLLDKKNRMRAELTLLSDGRPVLRFYDTRGKIILEMPEYKRK